MRTWGFELRARRVLLALSLTLPLLLPHTARAEGDIDSDGIEDAQDNCPTVSNEQQTNTDAMLPGGDALGDACDDDDDADGFPDEQDNCHGIPNEDQENSDGDEVGDACDNCPQLTNPLQVDFDADAIGDACDNCKAIPNHDQTNSDVDGSGDACDEDDDNDGLLDKHEAQDLLGTDPLLFDSDGDKISDKDEVCAVLGPCDTNGDGKPDGVDTDGDGTIDALDDDSDDDGLSDLDEAGDADPLTKPVDSDGDGTPDFQDVDSDDDGKPDATDTCLGDAGCDDGTGCATGEDCASGNCVNAVCCDTPCNGVCEYCSPAGTCTLQNAGFQPFVGDEKCVGDIIVDLVCNAAGDFEVQTQNCAPFACDQGSCSTGCKDHDECAGDLGYCDPVSHLCADKRPENVACALDYECLSEKCLLGLCGFTGEADCAADGFTLITEDSSTKSCLPFACQNAECLTACETIAECAESYVCSLEGQCVPRPDPTAEGGCAVPGSPADNRDLAALLLLPLLAAWRRRRHSRR